MRYKAKSDLISMSKQTSFVYCPNFQRRFWEKLAIASMQNRWKNGSLDDNLMVVVPVVRQQFHCTNTVHNSPWGDQKLDWFVEPIYSTVLTKKDLNHFSLRRVIRPCITWFPILQFPLMTYLAYILVIVNCTLKATPAVKVIREKSRSGRFLWNKNWDLGWI